MAQATLCLWHSSTQCYKKNTPLIRNITSQKGTQHKWHLAKMASHKNDISKVATQLIQKLDTNWKNLTLKSHEHGSESYKKLKNSLSTHSAQPLGIFYNVYHSYKAPFFRVSHLFILGGVFAMCHFCKVSLFLNYIKGYIFYAGCRFCWVYMMALFLFCYS